MQYVWPGIFVLANTASRASLKSASFFEGAVAQTLRLVIPVYCRQTGFSSASINFYEKLKVETEPTGCKENMAVRGPGKEIVRQRLTILCLALFLYSKMSMIHASISLTNRFHVAVRLFSNRSQMTSKCGKNKKVAHEASVTDVLTTFWRLLWSINESDARQHGMYLFYIITKIFQHNAKAGLLPRLCPAFARKKAI